MSSFIESSLNSSEGIDFNKAERLNEEGSTCDVYKAISQRRKVFVKRLKPEFRNRPFYLAAFDKEYDVGISLSHKSLPQYREIHEDYIVMDYIDGKSLAQMIREKDPWLKEEKNLLKLMDQLLDVVDYLHQHNVVHCDIKPSNIMLTAGNRNLILVDFDKCYTAWLNDTSGHPAEYEVAEDKIGDFSIDFHGMGMVAEKLLKNFPDLQSKRLRHFCKSCKKDDVLLSELEDILNSKSSLNKPLIGMTILLLLIVAVGFIPVINRNNPGELSSLNPPGKDTVILMQQNTTIHDVGESESKTLTHPLQETAETSSYNTQHRLKEEIEYELSHRFLPMYELMEIAEEVLVDSLASDDTLRDMGFQLAMMHSEIMLEAYAYFEKKYNNVNSRDIQLLVTESKSGKSLTKKWNDIQERLTKRIEERHK